MIGTVRVLDDAAEAGLVDLPTTLQRTIELDIHSHSALACSGRLLASSPNTFWGQVSFKLEKLEKILKKGENGHEERNSKATCSHTGNS